MHQEPFLFGVGCCLLIISMVLFYWSFSLKEGKDIRLPSFIKAEPTSLFLFACLYFIPAVILMVYNLP